MFDATDVSFDLVRAGESMKYYEFGCYALDRIFEVQEYFVADISYKKMRVTNYKSSFFLSLMREDYPWRDYVEVAPFDVLFKAVRRNFRRWRARHRPARRIPVVRKRDQQSTPRAKRMPEKLLRLYRFKSEYFVHFQSGGNVGIEETAEQVAARKEKRAVREAYFRAKAREVAALEQKKRLTKEERKAKYKAGRDKRVPIEVEYEAGGFLKAAFGATLGISAIAIHGLCKKVGEAVGKVGGLISKTSGTMDHLTSALRGVKRAMKQVNKAVGSVVGRIACVMLFWYALKLVSVPSGVGKVLLIPLFISLFGKELWNHVSAFFPFGDEGSFEPVVELQATGASTMAKLFSTCVCFSAFGISRGSKVTEFAKRLSMLDRVCTGWDSFLAWFIAAAEKVVNFGMSLFTERRVDWVKKMRDPLGDWMKDVDQSCTEVDRWMRGINVVSAELDSGNVNIDSAWLDKMYDQVRIGYGFKESARGTPFARDVDMYVLKAVSNLQPFLGALQARNNFRFQPEMCVLIGAPGVGKTALCVPFMTTVLSLSGLLPKDATFETALANMWQKGDSKYWNGYAQQLGLVIDDLFQEKVVTGQETSEYLDIIRMVGTWSYPLNFADLASKGKIYFGSKFILGTTNLESFSSQAANVVNCVSAVTRRISNAYTLKVNPLYAKANGELDWFKYQKACQDCESKEGIDAFPWYVWNAHKHDFAYGTYSSEAESLKDIVLRLATILRERNAAFTSEKGRYERLFNKCKDIHLQAGGEFPELQPVGLNRLLWGSVADYINYDRVPSPEGTLDTIDMCVEEVERESTLWRKFLKSFKLAAISTALMAVVVGALVGAVKGLLYVLGIPFRAAKLALSSFRRNPKKKIRLQSNTPARGKGVPSGVSFQAGNPAVTNKAFANCYKLVVHRTDGFKTLGALTFLEGQLAMQPSHFDASLAEWKKEGLITAESKISAVNAQNSAHRVDFSVAYYLARPRYVVPKTDICFMRFENMRAHVNITKAFIPESKLQYLEGREMRMDNLCTYGTSSGFTVTREVRFFRSMGIGVHLTFEAYGAPMHIDRYWRYSCTTESGDCGGLLSIEDNSRFQGATLMGFHFAAHDSAGEKLGAIVTPELIEKARQHFQIPEDRMLQDLEERGYKLEAGGDAPMEGMGSFLTIGALPKSVPLCPKTAYYPTRFFGKWGDSDLAPAHLRPVNKDGVVVYPMLNAIRPYSSPVLIYEDPDLEHAMWTATMKFKHVTRDSTRRLYTYREAVAGIPELESKGLPLNTSPGFPYVLEIKGGKKAIWGDAPERDFSRPESKKLEARVEYVIDQAKNNVRLGHLFYDFNKDELRTAAKRDAVATRLISCGPLDLVIPTKMYFGAIVDAFLKNYIAHGMAPGIKVYSDWERLAQHLTSKGDKVFDGDFKGFDSSQQVDIMNLILKFVNDWYDDGPENARIREVLWMDLTHSRHIGGDGTNQRFVYQWNKCLPSGHPLTTFVNSIYALFLMVFSYIKTTGDLTGFWTHVAPITFGDDNACNVSDEKIGQFNQRTTGVVLKEKLGIIYTPAHKNQDFVEHMALGDASFLKRGFAKVGGRWLCPLELDSFLYQTYYCTNHLMEETIMKDGTEYMLQELSMHPPREWDRFASQIYSCFRTIGRGAVPIAPCVQDEYLKIVLSRRDNPW